MPDWVSQLRSLVWIAVVAVVMGLCALATAIFVGDIVPVAGFGVFGLILAILSLNR